MHSPAPSIADPDLHGLVKAWADAWNEHDMEAAARLVTPDVEFVTVAGLWLRGRGEFLAHHKRIHTMQMAESRWTTLATATKAIQPSLMLMHVEWLITGDREADGTPRLPRQGLFTWLAQTERREWTIAVAHNTNLRSDLGHRLSGEAVGLQMGEHL
jgi:uncharacterized protein (TIGR02246 family)